MATMNHTMNDGNQSERRDSVRVEVPLDATYWCNSPPVRARLQDLSEHGTFIDTNHALSIGSEIEVEFSLPDTTVPIRARGRVAWSAPMMGSGVRFVDLPDDDRKRIKFFVAEVFFSQPPS